MLGGNLRRTSIFLGVRLVSYTSSGMVFDDGDILHLGSESTIGRP
jgi:hypothetical protein